MKITHGPKEKAMLNSLEAQDDLHRVLFVVLDGCTGDHHDLYVMITSMEEVSDDGSKAYEITGETLNGRKISGHCKLSCGGRVDEGTLQFVNAD